MDINELMIGDWARLRYFDSITGKEVLKDFQVTSVITESPWNHRAVILLIPCCYIVWQLTKVLVASWEIRELIKSGKKLRQRILDGEE